MAYPRFITITRDFEKNKIERLQPRNSCLSSGGWTLNNRCKGRVPGHQIMFCSCSLNFAWSSCEYPLCSCFSHERLTNICENREILVHRSLFPAHVSISEVGRAFLGPALSTQHLASWDRPPGSAVSWYHPAQETRESSPDVSAIKPGNDKGPFSQFSIVYLENTELYIGIELTLNSYCKYSQFKGYTIQSLTIYT